MYIICFSCFIIVKDIPDIQCGFHRSAESNASNCICLFFVLFFFYIRITIFVYFKCFFAPRRFAHSSNRVTIVLSPCCRCARPRCAASASFDKWRSKSRSRFAMLDGVSLIFNHVQHSLSCQLLREQLKEHQG